MTGPLRRSLSLALPLLASAAVAQQAAPRSGLVVTPTFTATQTFTDNSRGAGADAEAGNESITTVTPGVSISSRSGRVQGSLNYSLVGVLYGRDSQASNVRQRLALNARGELVPNHLDLNALASISRQPTSAFGRQAADDTLTERNQSDVRSLSLRPVLRGVLGGLVAVQATATATATDGGSGASTRGEGATLTLSPADSGKVISWSLTGSRQTSRFEGVERGATDRLSGSIFVRPDAELLVTVRGGQERSDLVGAESRRYENWGAGITWTPTNRTRVQLDGERRFFGESHTVSLEHRMRRSVWRYTDSRSVSDATSATGGGQVRAYDLFFELFASQEPDPVARDALVRSFLERNNLSPDALIGGGFLTRTPTVQRRQELSLALSGQRSTMVLSAFATRTDRVDPQAVADDDLANGAVRQRGLSVTVSHRLTPVSTLSLSGTTRRSLADADGRDNRIDTVQMAWSTQLSRRGTLSLSLRHSDYSDDTEPYNENALTAAFTARF